MEEIIILHTNDLHSHFENWPKIRRFLLEKKAENTEVSQTTVTVDLGDFVDRWHPLTEATDGQANIDLMNTIHYDGATIGNNEGVGNSKRQLNNLYNEANFDVLLGNLFDPDTGERPEWAEPYKIIETPSHTKIGLIALTAPFPLTYKPNGWDIRRVDEVLPELVQEVRPKCDLLILLSHLGIDNDIKIATNYPEIDVLLGSHTHHLFRYGEKINRTQLAAAGKFGQYVGEVHVFLEDGKIFKTTAEAHPTDELPFFPKDEEEIIGYMEQGHELLKRKSVAELPYELSNELDDRYPVIFKTLDAVKKRGRTEAAVLNTGLFLDELSKGVVTEDDLHRILPHPMHLIRVTLVGEDMIRLVREMEKNRQYLRKFPIMGMGFRGKIFGELCYDGIFYDKETKNVLWNGERIQKDRKYTLTTVDHFLFIPFFPTIEIVGEAEFLFPEFIRNVLGDYLRRHYPINKKQGIINDRW
ncbi:metallophosphatase [Enterococcus sp. BWT-B8]|uniref:bifunctional metallophosphatase/5'-nucleotidase n=1 Tax=Enterococcus sp. BWT-B8 TaxID=2885157 RepID=UPI001E4397DF|nr:bifunctional metallophosphatase/5'-nucleotidase [Enterococcus sp. BWT-B8]MCB5950994.1 metallophosphatase [Enterococcus sp. BWT-B8]